MRLKAETDGIGGEYEFTLTEPITEDQLAEITDAELEHTNIIYIRTPSGKQVEFVKLRTAKKKAYFHGESAPVLLSYTCGACGYHVNEHDVYCAGCGAKLV